MGPSAPRLRPVVRPKKCRPIYSYSEPFWIGPLPAESHICGPWEAVVEKYPSRYCAMPNSWRGYYKKSHPAQQSPYKCGFAATYGGEPCRLRCVRRLLDTGSAGRHGICARRSGDQSELADVRSVNDHGRSRHNGHLAQRRTDHPHGDIRTFRRSRRNDRPAVIAGPGRHVRRQAARKGQNLQLTSLNPAITPTTATFTKA